jgi:hypothetical protein
MTVIDGHQRIYRKSGKYYDVLEYHRYPYKPSMVDTLSKTIRNNLTDNLITKDIRNKYPANHPKWSQPYFGYCVPATFAMLYMMDTGTLEPVRGEDSSGEGHWWLRDILTREKYDLTLDQFPTYNELEDVYATGKPTPYYGFGQMPASRFFNLIQKVQSDAKRWKTSDYNEKSTNLEQFSSI